jgi:predicted DNA-binding protein with PD1-like motif
LGWLDPQRKRYKKILIEGQHEVIGTIGDIALYRGKPVVHTHIVVGGPDGTTRAGHVLAAYAFPTLEVMVRQAGLGTCQGDEASLVSHRWKHPR